MTIKYDYFMSEGDAIALRDLMRRESGLTDLPISDGGTPSQAAPPEPVVDSDTIVVELTKEQLDDLINLIDDDEEYNDIMEALLRPLQVHNRVVGNWDKYFRPTAAEVKAMSPQEYARYRDLLMLKARGGSLKALFPDSL